MSSDKSNKQLSNRELIQNECKELCGRYSNIFLHGNGYLLGAVDLADDYYYIFLCEDGEVSYSSCVSLPELLPEEDSPNSLFSLSDEDAKRQIDFANKHMIEEIRWSGINYIKTLGIELSESDLVRQEVCNRILHPENYIIYWLDTPKHEK